MSCFEQRFEHVWDNTGCVRMYVRATRFAGRAAAAGGIIVVGVTGIGGRMWDCGLMLAEHLALNPSLVQVCPLSTLPRSRSLAERPGLTLVVDLDDPPAPHTHNAGPPLR